MQRKFIILSSILGVPVLFFSAYLIFQKNSKEKKKYYAVDIDSIDKVFDDRILDPKDGVWKDTVVIYDKKIREEQAKRLWPNAGYKYTPKKRYTTEEIRKNWEKFEKKYPGNIYVPNFKELSNTEKYERRKIQDNYLKFERKFARNKQDKYTKVLESSESLENKNSYLNYKKRELVSKTQLIEHRFAVSGTSLTNDQRKSLQNRKEDYKKELTEVDKTIEKLQTKNPNNPTK